MPRRHLLAAAVACAVVVAVLASPASEPRKAQAFPAFSVVTTAFLPSVHGYDFRNPRPPEGASRLARMLSGRCGGMTYGSLDHFSAGSAPPRGPADDGYLVERSAASLLGNGARFLLWSVLPDARTSLLSPGVGELTIAEEVPALADALRSGPVPLGLVRARSLSEVGRNHQVVAYAIRRSGDRAIISVYDSCQPGADDVTLDVDLTDPAAPIIERAGEWEVARWRGLFVERYSPVEPSRD